MWENGCQKEAKLRLGGFLGPLLEALGAMWVPRGVPMVKKYEKGSCLHLFSGPHFGPFWVLFRTLKHFLERFFWVSVWIGFGTDFWVVFGVNLMCFWSAFFGFSRTAYANEKCGFDTLFTMFAAHSHVRKSMKNIKKCCQNWRCALGLSGARFWGPFWRVLGSLWGALGRHFGKKRGPERDQKNDAKNGSARKIGEDRGG